MMTAELSGEGHVTAWHDDRDAETAFWEAIAADPERYAFLNGRPVRPPTEDEQARLERRLATGYYSDLQRIADGVTAGPVTVPSLGEVVAAIEAGPPQPADAASDYDKALAEVADGTEAARLAEVAAGAKPEPDLTTFNALHDEQDAAEAGRGPDGTSVIPAVAAETQKFPAVSE